MICLDALNSVLKIKLYKKLGFSVCKVKNKLCDPKKYVNKTEINTIAVVIVT